MRTALVEHAHRLFSRRGVDGVSIADVATAAGASKANVIHHFGSKDGLYAAVLGLIDTHLDAAVDAAAASADPVTALPEALSAWAREHPDDVRVMAYGLLRLPEHGGRWALAGPVERMVDLVGGPTEHAVAQVVDLLGVVTYREMARPLLQAHPSPSHGHRGNGTAGGQP